MALVWERRPGAAAGATPLLWLATAGLDRELAGVRAQLDVQRARPGVSMRSWRAIWPNGDLQRQLADKREELGAKQALMQQLGHLSCKNPQGYAGVMADLAPPAGSPASPQRIRDKRRAHPTSRAWPNAGRDVPAWVNRFRQTPSLAGKQFGELTHRVGTRGQLAFQLSGIARGTP